MGGTLSSSLAFFIISCFGVLQRGHRTSLLMAVIPIISKDYFLLRAWWLPLKPKVKEINVERS